MGACATKAVLALAAVAGSAVCSGPAPADPPGTSCPDYTLQIPWNIPAAYSAHGGAAFHVASKKTRALVVLRNRVLAAQSRSGGRLSAADREIFQEALTAIQAGHY